MSRWEWRAYDLASSTPLGSVELSDWSHSDVLNDSGSWSATMTGRDATARRDNLAATVPGKAVIVPIRNGVPLGFTGIVWSRDPPNIAGSGLLSYFDRQPLNTRKAYVAYDQHFLIKDLVDWVQANGGNIQLDTSQVGPSYVYRDQTWERWEEKFVGEAIRQKADNLGGFEVDVRVEYDTGVLTRRLRMWTPRRGRYWVDNQTNVTFRLDGRRGNVTDISSLAVDATKLNTHIYAKGEEIDSTTHERRLAESVRTDILDAGWPRLGDTLDLNDIKDDATLQAHADGKAHLYGPTDIDEITLTVDPDDVMWPVGSWDLGDDCMVDIPAATIDWVPDALRLVRRVTSHDWKKTTSDETFQVKTGRPTTP